MSVNNNLVIEREKLNEKINSDRFQFMSEQAKVCKALVQVRLLTRIAFLEERKSFSLSRAFKEAFIEQK